MGGETIKLAGVDYLVVKAQILSAQWHQEAAAGFTSLSKFWKQFDKKEGFSLAFPSSSDSLPMKWWQVVKWADSVLLFAPPRNGVRAYNRLFKDETNVQWIQQIYRDMARETWGDAFMSLALTVAYQKRLIEIREIELVEARTTEQLLSFN